MRAFRGYVQGYNAQAAVNESQIVLAAEVTVDTGDFSHLQPMITAVVRELDRAGDPPAARGSGLILAIRLRFHRVDDIGKFYGILNEKNRDVVANEIPVALLRIDLHGKATYVPREIKGPLAPGDR